MSTPDSTSTVPVEDALFPRFADAFPTERDASTTLAPSSMRSFEELPKLQGADAFAAQTPLPRLDATTFPAAFVAPVAMPLRSHQEDPRHEPSVHPGANASLSVHPSSPQTNSFNAYPPAFMIS